MPHNLNMSWAPPLQPSQLLPSFILKVHIDRPYAQGVRNVTGPWGETAKKCAWAFGGIPLPTVEARKEMLQLKKQVEEDSATAPWHSGKREDDTDSSLRRHTQVMAQAWEEHLVNDRAAKGKKTARDKCAAQASYEIRTPPLLLFCFYRCSTNVFLLSLGRCLPTGFVSARFGVRVGVNVLVRGAQNLLFLARGNHCSAPKLTDAIEKTVGTHIYPGTTARITSSRTPVLTTEVGSECGVEI